MKDTAVLGLSDLVTAVNEELHDISPGPERDARLRSLAEGQLRTAKSKAERAFWTGFIRQLPEAVLSREQADALRTALRAARYTQAFDEEKCETWFAPEELEESRVLFFSSREAGVVVSYSDAQVYRTVTFEQAIAAANGGK